MKKKLYIVLLTFVLMLFAVPAFASIHIDKVTDLNGVVIPYDASNGLQTTPTSGIRVYGHTDGEPLSSAFGNTAEFCVREVNSSPRYSTDTVGVDNRVGTSFSGITPVNPTYGINQGWYAPQNTASLSYTSFSSPYSTTATYFISTFGFEWSGVGNANIRIAIIPASWGSSNSGMANVTETTFKQYELGSAYPVASNIPPETYDYSMMLYYQKKSGGLFHDNQYSVKASTMKIVNNQTDFDDNTPVSGTIYFDQPPTVLTPYWNTGNPSFMYLWGPSDPRVRNTQVPITQDVGAMTNLCESDNYTVGDPHSHENSPMYGDAFTTPVTARFVPDDSRYPQKFFTIPFNTLKDENDIGKILVNGNGGQNGDSTTPISGTAQDPGVNLGHLPDDGVLALFTNPMGLDTFKNTLDKLQHFDTSVPPAPKVTVDLNAIFNSMQRLTHITNPFPQSQYTLIDFSYLDQWQYLGYSVISYFRMLIGFGFILSTFEYCRRKIYSGRVIS